MAFKLKKFNIIGVKGESALPQNKVKSKSPLQQSPKQEALMEVFKKGGSFALSQSKLANLATKFLLPVSIVTSLYEMYKSGREGTGGRWGYEKNPNYDPLSGEGQHSEDEWSEEGTHGGTSQWRKSKPMFHESQSQQKSYEKMINSPDYFFKQNQKPTHEYSFNPDKEMNLLKNATSNPDGTVNFGGKIISQEAYQNLMSKYN